MATKNPLIAAIDVGTNSFHLIIASVNHRGMLYVHAREKETVRLGSSGKDMKYIRQFESKFFSKLDRLDKTNIMKI